MLMDTLMDTECSTVEVYTNISSDELLALSLLQREGVLASNGALAVDTGSRKKSSPKDYFIVKDSVTEGQVVWNAYHHSFQKETFNDLWEEAEHYLKQHDIFIQEVRTGGSDECSIPIKIICEYAYHALFCRTMYICDEWDGRDERTAWTLINVPGFKMDPAQEGLNSDVAIILNFTQKKILICGTPYVGEIKKAIFSVLNFILPEKNILPMHCAANATLNGDVTLFFGLSGVSETVLSACSEQLFIGDDAHGWNIDEIFNMEIGCYVKVFNLSAEKNPLVWNAIRQGAIVENVVIDSASHLPNFSDTSLSKNARVIYPRNYIENTVSENKGKNPSTVIFFTRDLYGVLPAVAKLTKEQAIYYFLSGYTSVVNETEVGLQAISPLFNTCFGAPFFPRDPSIYANLLMKRIEEANCDIYLVNTGCVGGVYDNGGERFSAASTCAIIRAIINNDFKQTECETLSGFELAIPKAIKGVDSALLNPKNKWKNVGEYEETLKMLIKRFQENFRQFSVDQSVIDSGPKEK
jgi:phosphoenolpyruvate carboxykinase (ATP)